MKRTLHGLGPRLLFYSHDTYGLGHFRRTLAIADAIARRCPTVSMLCATGSPRSHSFPMPSNFDVVKLPSSTKDEQGEYTARSLDISFDRLVEMRSRLLLETARAYRPDLILVDHSPAGMAGELRPMLEAVRRDLPATALWLGLRDVIDDPSRVQDEWARGRLFPLVAEVYHRIFVYGVEKVYDLPREYGWPATLSARLSFTGFVHDGGPRSTPREVRRQLGLKKRPLVVVTVGGGGDGDRLLRSLAQALRRDPRPQFECVVLTGPLLSESKRGRIEARLHRTKGVRTLAFHEDVPALFAAADLVVSMGGYNSVVEILAFARRGLVAPRTFPRLEQSVRANRLAELGWIETLSDDAPEPEELRSRIERALATAAERPGLLPEHLDGAARMAIEVERTLLSPQPIPSAPMAATGASR